MSLKKSKSFLILWLADGVTGNTSGFGPEESRFEPWSANSLSPKLNALTWDFFLNKIENQHLYSTWLNFIDFKNTVRVNC